MLNPADRPAPSLKRRLCNLPFWAVHAASLGVWFVDFQWRWVGLCVFLYGIRMFGITAGYHRYFSHRTYRMNRFWQFWMAWLGASSLQMGPLWWAAHHRHHHRYSDTPEDIHSPLQRGFWYSHCFWFLDGHNDQTRTELIPDLIRYPELRWLERWHLLPGISLAVGCLAWGGPQAFFWGFALSTVLLWHGTFTINSLAHVIGTRRFETTDTSRNHLGLALITLGEGWHNNHHRYQSSANQGFFWWEIDVSFYVLKLLSLLGIVSKLQKAPLHRLLASTPRPELSPDISPQT
jgi:stearoyl-CoA desaturase (delta-9 desaturase)